jgi:PAS domain S-box-containing protein
MAKILIVDDRAELSRKVEGVVARLEALIEHNLEVSSQRDPLLLLEHFCHSARAIVGAKYAAVGVFPATTQAACPLFTSGLDAEATARLTSTPLPPELVGQLQAERRPRRLQARDDDPQTLGLPAAFPAASSVLLAPVSSPVRVHGWLCLMDKLGDGPFSEEDERLGGILAAQVGRVYEIGSLYAEAHRHAADLEREVTERRQAEEALRDREGQIRLLLDATAEAIYGLDLQGNCTFCNRACVRLLGYADPRDLLGKNMHALIHSERPDGGPCSGEGCRMDQAFRQGEGTHLDEEVLRRADGTSFPAEYWSYPVRRDGALVGAVVTFLDITERKRLEEQFRQAQKMEVVGRLAGGVAHEFNNLLTVIMGYSEMLLGARPPTAPSHNLALEIRKAGERAASLTRQLLGFSRKQVLTPMVLDLNAVLAEMKTLLPRLIGEDIELAFALDPALGRVRADPGEIEQVIMNLVVNARDAMPRGGRLTIETRNQAPDESSARQHPEVPPGPHVLLAVGDTGCGMDPPTLARIFEPFFTTKEPGKGTGLGLATVYGIVKQSGGHIAVASEPGHGTTFTIYLPRVEAPLPASGVRPALPGLPRGTGTILLVEDEEGIRKLARLVLAAQGYTVLAARGGREALQICAQHPDTIHLLVTDVVMPEMSGGELAELLVARRPALRVLYLSGYTPDAVVRHGVREGGTAFLQKPFTPASLAGKVYEVLGLNR